MRLFLRDVYLLVSPYWRSDEKWGAWLLLTVIVALNLSLVYLNVLLNRWNSEFYNSLQDVDKSAFIYAIMKFSWIAGLFIIHGVYQSYLNQMLLIRWRRWMTQHYLNSWMASKAYYRMQIIDLQSDNPDQRIADDIGQFTDLMLGLTLGLMNAIVTLFSFLFILWTLSGTLVFDVGGYEIILPGYMVWAALLYAVIGTVATIKLGKPLVQLNFNQHRYEADFRFSLVRLRENSESIAFYNGEDQEKNHLLMRFSSIFKNYWQMMKRRKTLGWFTSIYQQITVVLPYIFVAPRFFAGQIKLGGVMQTVSAFGQVEWALSYIVNTYGNIAVWKAVVDRLTSFSATINQTNSKLDHSRTVFFNQTQDTSLVIEKMTVRLPNDYVLLKDISLTVKKGDSLLIKGSSGSGKSTFLRALAGLWPYAEGRISVPEKSISLFVPQKPYLPLGTLRQVLAYPGDSADLEDKILAEILSCCHLGHLIDRLDKAENWSHILSLGEQQRMAFARVILLRADLVFLDEATSALDEETEAYLYGLLRQRLPDAIILSIGHRHTLEKWHNKVIDIKIFAP